MDVLETYPRDELFQTPIDELVPIAEARAARCASAASCGCSCATTPTVGYLSCLVYLPRDRYTTQVRERIACDPQDASSTASRLEYTARVSESMLARLHFVVRPTQGEPIGEFDHDDLERRLAEAARSWRDDLVQAIHAEYGEEAGRATLPGLRRRVPGGLQGGLPAPHAARSTSAGSRPSSGEEGVALSSRTS